MARAARSPSAIRQSGLGPYGGNKLRPKVTKSVRIGRVRAPSSPRSSRMPSFGGKPGTKATAARILPLIRGGGRAG